MRSVLPAPVAQDQIWHDFNTFRGDTSGISLEAIEQLYCGLGDTSLRIQVQTLNSPIPDVPAFSWLVRKRAPARASR